MRVGRIKIVMLLVIILFFPLGAAYSYSEHTIPLDSIKFELNKKNMFFPQESQKLKEEQIFSISITYTKDEKDLGFHGAHYIAIKDNKKDVTFGVAYIYYNSKSGVVYGITDGEKHLFRLGTGEIIGEKFMPTFIDGLKFTFHPRDTSDPMDQSIITICLPFTVEELFLDEK